MADGQQVSVVAGHEQRLGSRSRYAGNHCPDRADRAEPGCINTISINPPPTRPYHALRELGQHAGLGRTPGHPLLEALRRKAPNLLADLRHISLKKI